jgi:predicted transcriptional regulator
MVKRLHPIDKEILRALARSRMKVTPARISRAISIHPLTAQRRIQELSMKKLVNCKRVGNRTYCTPININELKKKLKKDFFFS